VERRRNKAERLRTAVEMLPRHTREAMLRGIAGNRIIVGAYTDRNGGVCPMLAAHRNGGRTSFASFARAWDDFTSAPKRPRRASRRELQALRSYLEMSLLAEDTRQESLVTIAGNIRAERRDAADRAAATAAEATPSGDPLVRPGDPSRGAELRTRQRWSWLRPARRLDVYEATLAAASEQLNEQRADHALASRPAAEDPAAEPTSPGATR
jgi:hypothetical protein